MKTALDQNFAIYKLLNVPEVTSVISGDIYHSRRPTDSDKEDIVIGTITLGDGTRQFGVANVNIYVKDLDVTIVGRDQHICNTARLLTLSNLIKPLLEETDGDDFALWIESTELIDEPEVNQHLIQIRLEVRMYNIH